VAAARAEGQPKRIGARPDGAKRGAVNLSLFARGALVGLSIAAPVGPIGVLCIRRALRDGFRAGFVAGLGAATADALYGCVAGFGLTAVSGFLLREQFWIALLGGALLCYLGLGTLRSRPPSEDRPLPAGGHAAAYASTFAFTLANPATILSFVAIFAAFGPGAVAGYGAAAQLVLGVFAGSAAWWLVLSAGVSAARLRATPRAQRILGGLCGAVLLAFGVAALVRAAFLR